MNIGIVGQGFVGNAVFEKFKIFFNVYTFDINNDLCNSSIEEIKEKCRIVFICLPTPMNKDGSCDISKVENTLKLFDDKKDIIIVNKSTVPPGTTENFNKKYINNKIVFNPEFLTERNAVEDFNNQSRVILGGPRPATTILKSLFNKVFPKANVIKTGSTHAEMIKYFTNTFLATKVAFANEIYQLCLKLNLDYDKVLEYVLYDNRIGKSHLNVPGPDGDLGFGGHCFPKDLSAIISLSENLNLESTLLKAVRQSNDIIRKNRDWEQMKGRAVN